MRALKLALVYLNAQEKKKKKPGISYAIYISQFFILQMRKLTG